MRRGPVHGWLQTADLEMSMTCAGISFWNLKTGIGQAGSGRREDAMEMQWKKSAKGFK